MYLILRLSTSNVLLAAMIPEVPDVRLSVDAFKVAVLAGINRPRPVGHRQRQIDIIGVAIHHMFLECGCMNGGVVAERTPVGPGSAIQFSCSNLGLQNKFEIQL